MCDHNMKIFYGGTTAPIIVSAGLFIMTYGAFTDMDELLNVLIHLLIGQDI